METDATDSLETEVSVLERKTVWVTVSGNERVW